MNTTVNVLCYKSKTLANGEPINDSYQQRRWKEIF